MMAGGYQTTSFIHDKPGSFSLPSYICCVLRTEKKEVLKGSQNDTDISKNKRCFCCSENTMCSVCRYRKSQNFCRGIHKFITACSKLYTILCQFHSFPFLTMSSRFTLMVPSHLQIDIQREQLPKISKTKLLQAFILPIQARDH